MGRGWLGSAMAWMGGGWLLIVLAMGWTANELMAVGAMRTDLPDTGQIVWIGGAVLVIGAGFAGFGLWSGAQREQRYLRMLDGMPVAVMTARPTDGVITYMNATSRSHVGRIEHLLPVKSGQMIGSSIDLFHKNPAHQRSIIAKPDRLPWNTKIRLGPETLDLRISAIHDAFGGYSGPLLTWSIVTDRVGLADGFETNVKSIVDRLMEQSGGLNGTARMMSHAADQTNGQISMAAAAVEQLNSSVQEIARQVHDQADISRDAVARVTASNAQVAGLSDAATRIGEVVQLIRSIAGKTDILALNAAIEAARAGDAGKGFAVVAEEVKALSGQTAAATEEIVEQVDAIRAAIARAVEAIGGIDASIRTMDGVTTIIASAVEEQTAATAEVADTIARVTHSAAETARSAQTVETSAGDLWEMAERLSQEVRGFMVEVRRI